MSSERELEQLNQVDIYTLLPISVQEAIGKLPQELLNISETELLETFTPTRQDRLLRTSLWAEFTRKVTNVSTKSAMPTKLNMRSIYNKIVSKDVFYHHVITNPKRLTYLMTPPVNYHLQMENMLDIATNKLFEILTLPIYEGGKVSPTILNAQLKAAFGIRDIVKGPAIQRNININANMNEPEKLTIEEIDKKILELRNQVNIQEPDEDVIEAESSDG